MADKRTYEGGCHCGKVRYKVATDLAQVIECNCSICSKKGSLLTFVMPEQFDLVSGQDEVTSYLFNRQVIHHLFCKTCGVESYASGVGPGGKAMFAINVRCLEGVDTSGLERTPFDGRSL